MIFVTKLSGDKYLLNHRLIEKAQAKPDTTLTMTSGKKVIIKESLEELYDIVLAYDKKVQSFENIIEDKE